MRLRSAALFATLALAITAHAQLADLQAPKIPYQTCTLPNGLQVILSEDHTVPLVAVNVWYHVGAANESQGHAGLAHLFEHMMFEGSLHVGPKSHFNYLEAAGASSANGTTSFDRTNYYETLPSNQLALGLWLESDRMGFLLDTLDRAKLTNQRDTVRNERRQTHENVPYGVSDEAMYHALFPSTHPYYGNVMGSHQDIEGARLADVRSFFEHFYTPNNATLAIVGDFKPAEARALIEKYFGPLKHGPDKPALHVATPTITAERRIHVTDQVQLPAVSLAWLTPPDFAPGDAELDFAADILGEGHSSRLYQQLVYKQQIAQSATCSHASLQLGSVFECEFVARPNVTADQLEHAAEAVIADFAANGPTDEEMQRASVRSITDLIRPLEDVQSVADNLQSYNQAKGDPGFLPHDMDRYKAVTRKAVIASVAQYLGDNQRVVVTTTPGPRTLEDVPRSAADADANYVVKPEYTKDFMTAQAFRDHAPAPGPLPVFHLPRPVTFTLPNGLDVYVIERHKLPLFSASLVTYAGSSADTVAKPGVSGFTAAMLPAGTATRSATQITNTAADLGLQLGTATATDIASANVSALTSTREQALDLFADVLQHPAFAPQEVDRARARRATELLQSRDEPMAIAQRVALRAVFGEDSPYGYNSSGTDASTAATTRDDLTNFYAAHYGPKNAVLVFAGDITIAQARELAAHYFGGWNATAQRFTAPPARQANTHKIIVVDQHGAPQTAVIAAGLGLPRSTPDFPAIEVMNTPLGGLFSSRINMDLREEHGYTYGASSDFVYRRNSGLFLANASVRTDITADAVKELYAQLNGIHTKPLTDAEVKLGKDSEIRSLPASFSTNGALAGVMAELWVYKLPLDYFETLPERVEAVTTAQANQAAADHIHPDSLVLVTVGDKSQIAEKLGALNLGPVEEWTEDAEPKK